jgi:hypothetical protein
MRNVDLVGFIAARMVKTSPIAEILLENEIDSHLLAAWARRRRRIGPRMALLAKACLYASRLVVDFAVAQGLEVNPCVPAISWHSRSIPLLGN